LKAYFVRKTPDEEVVGLFVASSALALAALVDEHCDPTLCEYAVATVGGLIVPTVTKAKWPQPAGQSSVSTGLDAQTTSLEWKPLKPAVQRLLRKLGRGSKRLRASLADQPAKIAKA
jgi:hypothetical protein